MRKFTLKFLSILLMSSLLTALQAIKPKAALQGSTYDYACSTAYSADYINDDGSFSNAFCTNDVNEAKKVLDWGDDYVVRARDNLSPTKIVMMKGGLVYSYPQRGGSRTVTLNELNGGMSTYVTVHREMKYEWTEYVNGDNGKIVVSLNGVTARIDLKLVDLIPWKYVNKSIPITLGGHDTTAVNEQPFKTHIYQSHYKVENHKLTFIWSSGWSENGWPAVYQHPLGPVDESIPDGVYFSYDGYNFFYDRNCDNLAFTYYNYYQFLPMRSKTNLTADQMNSFIESRLRGNQYSVLRGKGQAFIDAQNKYGVNGALVLAIACLESGTGTSQYATQRNNLFGLSAYDSSPDSATYFPSVEECINQMMGYYLKDYMDDKDPRHFGMHLGNKGSGVNVKYAADPYWGIKIASIYYEMDRHSNGDNLKDYGSVKRGLVTTHAANVYLNSNGSGLLYNTANRNDYQKVFTLPIIGDAGDYYQFQSNNLIENGAIVSNGYLKYNWDNSKAYIKKGDVQVLDMGSTIPNVEEGTVPTGDFNFTASIAWKDDHTLTISGSAYRPGIKITEDNTLTIIAKRLSQFFEGVELETKVTIGSDKCAASYSFDVDLSDIENGDYKFFIDAIYSKLNEYSEMDKYIVVSELPESKVVGNQAISFTKDDDGIVTMNVATKTIEPEKPVEPEVPEKPVEPEIPVEKKHSIDATILSVDTKDNRLSFTGYAYLMGLDALESNKDNISIEVSLIDKLTENRIPMDLNIESLDTPIYSDGKVVEYCYFTASKSLTDLPISTYVVDVKVENNDYSGSTVIRTSDKSLLLSKFNPETNDSFTIIENYNYLYRIEISNEKVPFILSEKNNLKTSRGIAMSLTDAILSENEGKTQLSLSFMSFIRQTNIKASDAIKGKIYVYDKNSGKVVKEINNDQLVYSDTGGIDIAVDNGYTVYGGLVTTTIDISDLANGQYLFLYEQETNADSKDQKGIVEIAGMGIKPSSLDDSEQSYACYSTGVRNRIELTINTTKALSNNSEEQANTEVSDDKLLSSDTPVSSDSSEVANDSVTYFVINEGNEKEKGI